MPSRCVRARRVPSDRASRLDPRARLEIGGRIEDDALAGCQARADLDEALAGAAGPSARSAATRARRRRPPRRARDLRARRSALAGTSSRGCFGPGQEQAREGSDRRLDAGGQVHAHRAPPRARGRRRRRSPRRVPSGACRRARAPLRRPAERRAASSSPGAASTRRPCADARRTSGRPGAARSPGETIFSTTIGVERAPPGPTASGRSRRVRRRAPRAEARPAAAAASSWRALLELDGRRGAARPRASRSEPGSCAPARAAERAAATAARALSAAPSDSRCLEAHEHRARADRSVPAPRGPPRPAPRAGSRAPPPCRPTTTPSTSTGAAAVAPLDRGRRERALGRRGRGRRLLRAAAARRAPRAPGSQNPSSSLVSLRRQTQGQPQIRLRDDPVGRRPDRAHSRAQLGGARLEQIGEPRGPFLVARLLDLARLRGPRPRASLEGLPAAPPRRRARPAPGRSRSAPRGRASRAAASRRTSAAARASATRASMPPEAKSGTRKPPKTVPELPYRPPGVGAWSSYRPVTTSVGQREAAAARSASCGRVGGELRRGDVGPLGGRLPGGSGGGCGSGASGRAAASLPIRAPSAARAPSQRGAAPASLGAHLRERRASPRGIGGRRHAFLGQRCGDRRRPSRASASRSRRISTRLLGPARRREGRDRLKTAASRARPAASSAASAGRSAARAPARAEPKRSTVQAAARPNRSSPS